MGDKVVGTVTSSMTLLRRCDLQAVQSLHRDRECHIPKLMMQQEAWGAATSEQHTVHSNIMGPERQGWMRVPGYPLEVALEWHRMIVCAATQHLPTNRGGKGEALDEMLAQ